MSGKFCGKKELVTSPCAAVLKHLPPLTMAINRIERDRKWSHRIIWLWRYGIFTTLKIKITQKMGIHYMLNVKLCQTFSTSDYISYPVYIISTYYKQEWKSHICNMAQHQLHSLLDHLWSSLMNCFHNIRLWSRSQTSIEKSWRQGRQQLLSAFITKIWHPKVTLSCKSFPSTKKSTPM